MDTQKLFYASVAALVASGIFVAIQDTGPLWALFGFCLCNVIYATIMSGYDKHNK